MANRVSVFCCSKKYNPFILKVNSGADSQFTIPTTGGGYNYDLRVQGGQSWYGLTGNHTINFPSANTDYLIEISGEFPRIYINNNSERLKFLEVVQVGDIKWMSFQNAFWGASNLTWSATDAPDLSSVTNMIRMFRDCQSLSILDASNWNVSSVINTAQMFYNCSSLTTLDVSNWNVSGVASMDAMFQQCTSLTTLDVSSWNVSSVTTMIQMFYNCYLWDNNLNNWNVPSLVNANQMFRYSGFTNGGVTLDWSDATTGSINLEDAHAFAYNTGLLGYKLQAGSIALNVNNNFTNSATLTELLGMKSSFFIANAPITGSAIDNLFTSLGTANSGATITITTAQSTSGIDTTIATSKGWTIVII